MSLNEDPRRPFHLSRLRERADVRALPLRKAGLTAVLVAGGLLALDAIGFIATVYYGPELLKAAEAAGVAGLLKP